jgi:hypothetical protein
MERYPKIKALQAFSVLLRQVFATPRKPFTMTQFANT